jgi:hypothetical protein
LTSSFVINYDYITFDEIDSGVWGGGQFDDELRGQPAVFQRRWRAGYHPQSGENTL